MWLWLMMIPTQYYWWYTRWETWLPGSGGRLKVLKWNLHSFQLLEIIKVLDSISWVRCASGNVKKMRLFFFDSPERPLRCLDYHNQRTHIESPPRYFRLAKPNNPGRKFAYRVINWNIWDGRCQCFLNNHLAMLLVSKMVVPYANLSFCLCRTLWVPTLPLLFLFPFPSFPSFPFPFPSDSKLA